MIAVGDGGLDTAPFSRFDPVRIDERLAAKLDVVVLPEAMRRLQLGVIRVMPELHRRGVRVLPGGDYGFAYNPIGRNARDLELFVTLFGFTPPTRWWPPPATAASSWTSPLDRISEIDALPCGVGLDVVPERRVVELARYGLAGKTGLLKRHPPARRHAILVASVRYLRRRATDDALELLDELVANELVGNAVRSAEKGVIREHSRMTVAASSLATAVRVLLACTDQPVRPTLKR